MVAQRLEDLDRNGSVAETLTLEWRDAPLHVQVIDMPLNVLYYNPGTHRIRAQRSLDQVRDAALSADPWSQESQDYLKRLLTYRPADPTLPDPDFGKLADHLEEFGQIEPGLITREGILVNGNTRCAALRGGSKATSMRVGVLPASCTWDDINAVEVSLQLRRDKRRDYSYINHLLALEEQRDQLHRPISVIAKAFHTTTTVCERDFWVLAELQNCIERSRTPEKESMRLMDFEESKEKLAELYRVYREEHKKNPGRAELLKESRLAAIVLDYAKTDVRFIGSDFQDRYLDKGLIEEFGQTEPGTVAAVAIPGLGRSTRAPGADVTTARAITDKLLQAKAVEAAGDAVGEPTKTAATKLILSYRAAFGDAITVAGRDAMLRKKRLAAPDRVVAACKDLEQAVTDLVLARGNSSLDEDAFDDALIQVHMVLEQLAIEAQRSVKIPGSGLDWLSAAVETRPQR
ncbi:ParB N-terminal domain-containing protein [Nocardia salmonicida]|uniref:transcriptional regulator n=1 Tax=Nocardia salmonicida TaxID=53431 RepID=UPI001C3FD2AA|nr:transcriptional regulator [Nocardia salmonicida]